MLSAETNASQSCGSKDPVEYRTHDGNKYRLLNVIDEFTRKCVAILFSRRLKSADAIDVLSTLSILRDIPGQVRSDNGPEYIADAAQAWISAVRESTADIAPGSPWEKRYIESFNARGRGELLNGKIFILLKDEQIIIEGRHHRHNTARPHASFGHRTPRPKVFVPCLATRPFARCEAVPTTTRGLAKAQSIN